MPSVPTSWTALRWMKIIRDITPLTAWLPRCWDLPAGDKPGIVGLEVKYDEYLQGEPGTILTVTDARGVEVTKEGGRPGGSRSTVTISISAWMNIEQYATQLANQVLAAKEAESVSILVMKPDNGEILAMVNVPEFNLNEPFTPAGRHGGGGFVRKGKTGSAESDVAKRLY